MFMQQCVQRGVQLVWRPVVRLVLQLVSRLGEQLALQQV
jgi:hypothetical protein